MQETSITIAVCAMANSGARLSAIPQKSPDQGCRLLDPRRNWISIHPGSPGPYTGTMALPDFSIHASEKTLRLVLVSLMFLAAPMPCYMMLCTGFLPPGVQFVLSFSMLITGDRLFLFSVFSLLFAICLIYFISRLLVGKIICRHGLPNLKALIITISIILITGLAPLHWFDCIDGYSRKTCDAIQAYTTMFTDEKLCGDF
jgi:hypothetical protein